MAKATKLTRAEQKALRPAQILEAAFDEFVRHGFSAARVEDIAEHVGVTKGTVYVYFATKEQLFEAMIEHISAPFVAFADKLTQLEGRPAAKLIALVDLMFDHMAEDRRSRELLRFVISEGLRFPDLIDRHHNQFIGPVIAKIDSVLKEGVASGEFREPPAQFPELIAAPVLTSTVLQLIFDERRGPDRLALRKATASYLLHGLMTERVAVEALESFDAETATI